MDEINFLSLGRDAVLGCLGFLVDVFTATRLDLVDVAEMDRELVATIPRSMGSITDIFSMERLKW